MSARKKPSILVSFTRSQVASATASAADFAVMIALVELAGFWPTWATAFGAFVGAVTNFTLGRNWSFEAKQGRVRGQAFRYALVSGGSLLLNSSGVYVFNHMLGVRYVAARLITAFVVGILFNFPLHRTFVFR